MKFFNKRRCGKRGRWKIFYRKKPAYIVYARYAHLGTISPPFKNKSDAVARREHERVSLRNNLGIKKPRVVVRKIYTRERRI